MRGSRRVSAGGDSHHGGLGAGKARSVAGGDHDRDRAGQRRSLGAANALMPSTPLLMSPSGRGPAKGRSDLVEKLVLEDGPERTISVWREHVAKNETGGRGGRGAGASGGDDGAAGASATGEGEGRSELDSHVGRRRVSTDSRRRVDSLAQGGSSVKGKGHRTRESAEFTEVSVQILSLQTRR